MPFTEFHVRVCFHEIANNDKLESLLSLTPLAYPQSSLASKTVKLAPFSYATLFK